MPSELSGRLASWFPCRPLGQHQEKWKGGRYSPQIRGRRACWPRSSSQTMAGRFPVRWSGRQGLQRQGGLSRQTMHVLRDRNSWRMAGVGQWEIVPHLGVIAIRAQAASAGIWPLFDNRQDRHMNTRRCLGGRASCVSHPPIPTTKSHYSCHEPSRHSSHCSAPRWRRLRFPFGESLCRRRCWAGRGYFDHFAAARPDLILSA